MAYGARSDRVALGVRVSPLTPDRPRGGIGRRSALKSRRRKSWMFKSSRGHQRRGWRNEDALGLNPGGPRSCRFKSCAAHQPKTLLPSPSGLRHRVYTAAFSLVRIRPGVRVRSSAVAALSRHGRGRRFNPVRTHHHHALLAQRQSARLISVRSVVQSHEGAPTSKISPFDASRSLIRASLSAENATEGQNMQILSKPERLAAATIKMMDPER